MDDMTGGRSAPKPKKRPNRFVRFLAFLVTLALMVGAVALVANYDKLNFDFIKRWFSYRGRGGRFRQRQDHIGKPDSPVF